MNASSSGFFAHSSARSTEALGIAEVSPQSTHKASRKTDYEYIELQSINSSYRDDSYEPVESLPMSMGIFFNFLPLVFLVLGVYLVKQQGWLTTDSQALTRNTAEALNTQNALLRESIQLQRELLIHMRERFDEVG